MANFNGGAFGDFFFGDAEDDIVFGNGGDDFLIGGAGNDQIDGGNDNDELQGGLGNDVIRGGAGHDSITGDGGFGSPGLDTLSGGAGNDRFNWQVGSTDSTFGARDVVTDFEGAGVAGGDTLELRLSFDNPNRLVFQGQLAAMPALGGAMSFANNGFTEVFFAFAGANTMVFADSNDNGVLDATDFVVQLTGRQNLIRSDFGATGFVTRGTAGGDIINGTADADTIFALGGGDIVNGGGGNDSIDGGDGADILNGDAGRDRINGGAGADILNGGADGDFLTGDAGNDIVDGGAGDDSVSGGDGNDIVSGGAGDDDVDGDDGNDVMTGGGGEDNMVGGDGNDIISGEAGDDFLQGGAGNDTMSGGDGDDEIVGYEGVDINQGGAGDDTFGFFLGTFAPSSTLAAADTVLDFQGAGVAGGDMIDLNFETVAFGGKLNINPQAGALLPGTGDGVTQLFYAQRANTTWLFADENDNGRLDGTDFTVKFSGIHNFTRDDFDRTDFVIVGTGGNDVITGTEDADRVFAAGGNDQVFGLGGDDELNGGDGNDLLEGGPGGFDILNGDLGDDALSLATSDAGVASGGGGNDTLTGSDVIFSFSDLKGEDGNDTLQAGAWGANMDGGNGADRMISGIGDDQMVGGRDENFELDGQEDLFVYGADDWGSDTLFDFEDGVDKFDLRGSGLTYDDLTIDNQDFQTTITSAKGMISIFENFDQPVEITAADFLFV
jgi:Ca2+-binding RTX toxin-like protein